MIPFTKEWFDHHQSTLLFLLNHRILKYWFRWILRIHHDLGWDERIVRLMPNNYSVSLGMEDDRVKLRTDFRSHAKFSKRIYHAFKYIWWAMHYWDLLIEWLFPRRVYSELSFGFSTLTVYSDPHPETKTTDAMTSGGEENSTWQQVAAANGTTVTADSNQVYPGVDSSQYYTDKWRNVDRTHHLFDTSTLGSVSIINSAVLSLYKAGQLDELSCTPTIAAYSTNPASNTEIVASDHQTVGSTALSSSIAYADWNAGSGYQDFTLNSTGLAAISKTGISKFSFRNNYDATATTPTESWIINKTSYFSYYMAEYTGTTRDPKLVIQSVAQRAMFK